MVVAIKGGIEKRSQEWEVGSAVADFNRAIALDGEFAAG
jgi:hypothetical protein